MCFPVQQDFIRFGDTTRTRGVMACSFLSFQPSNVDFRIERNRVLRSQLLYSALVFMDLSPLKGFRHLRSPTIGDEAVVDIDAGGKLPASLVNAR
jgi:hypothetical protein